MAIPTDGLQGEARRLKGHPKKKAPHPRGMLVTRLRSFSFLSVILFYHIVLSQDALVLTPDKAVDMALRANHRLRAAQYEVQEAAAGKWEAFGRFFPSVSAHSYYKRTSGVPGIYGPPAAADRLPEEFSDSLSATINTMVERAIEGFTQSIPMGSVNNYGVGVSLQQPVFSGFKIINAYRAAEIRIDMRRLAQKKTEQTVAFGAMSLFWTAFFLEKSIALASDADRRVEAIQNDLESRFRQQLVPEYELLQVRAAHASAKVAVVKAKRRFEEGMRNLRDWLSIDGGETIELRAEIGDSALLRECGDLQAYLNSVRGARPDFLLLERESDLAALDGKIIKADRLPCVGLTGEFSYARPNTVVSLSDAWKHSWSIQVLASWNVFDWGTSFHKERLTEYRLKALAEIRRISDREILSQARGAWENVGACRAELISLNRATAACECKYRAMTLQFQRSVISASDLLNAQLELSQARLTEQSARIQLIIALENMKIGGLGSPKS
jgi:outer membrane protein TolC